MSTSRPCRLCEAAAAEARIARMVHGDALTDAGPLIAHGTNVNLADKQGVTPLAHAEQRGRRVIGEALRAAGARVVQPPSR